MADEIVENTPILKEKKPRSPAQIAAFQKAQEKRISNAAARKEAIATEKISERIEKLQDKLPAAKISEEEALPVVPVKKVVKTSPTVRQALVEADEQPEPEPDTTPIVKPKVKSVPRKVPAVEKASPVVPKVYFC